MTQQDSPQCGEHNIAKQNSTGQLMERNNKMLLLSIMEVLDSLFMTLLPTYKIGAFYTCNNKTLQHQIPLYCTNYYRHRKQRKNKRLYIHESYQAVFFQAMESFWISQACNCFITLTVSARQLSECSSFQCTF